MGALVRVELCKAIKNKWFVIAVVLGCLLALVSAVGNILLGLQFEAQNISYMKVTYQELSALSLYHFWIVTDLTQPATDLFFLLVPLLVVLPYSWSLASELKNNSISHSLTRTTPIKYYGAKLFAAFVAGSLSVSIPIVLNFVVCACFLPAYVPQISAVIYLAIAQGTLWSYLFYTTPLLYSALMVLINFLFGGLWAMVVMSLAIFIKNRIALICGPFLVLLFIKFFESRVFSFNAHFGFTPFTYLRGIGGDFFSNGWVVCGEYVVFFVFVCIVLSLFCRRDVL